MGRSAVRCSLAIALGLALAGCGGSTEPGGTLTIGLTPSSVSFAAIQGGANPSSRTVTVTNNGARPVTGLALGTIGYDGTATGWLNASLDATSNPARVTLAPTTGALASGVYTATMQVSSAAASNGPLTLTVTFLVLSDGQVTNLAAAGQSSLFLASPQFATQLAVPTGGAQYLIAVVNTDPTYTTSADFTLVGAQLEGGPVTRVATPQRVGPMPGPDSRGPTYTLQGPSAARLDRMRRLTGSHLQLLDRNRRLYSRFAPRRADRARRAAARAGVAPLVSSISETVGTVNKIYVANSLSSSCAAVDSIGARTVAVGQHVMVLADTNLTNWPESQRPDSSFYQTFADEYDQVTWPHTLAYFGDPLAYDSQLSSLGKVTLTITPVLNAIEGGGAVAFINSCDFFPFAGSGPDANFSNETEMFYSMTPAADGFDVASWQKELRGTAPHETKHLVAFASRILSNSPVLDEVWLEEGLAQLSAEIWMRHFNEATWKGNADFRQTIGCELNLGLACNAANDKPYALVLSHLPFLFTYLQNESQSNSAGLGADVFATYGAGWSFARWVTDQYAGNEGAFTQLLTQEPALTGLDNLSSHTAQPAPLLLVYWNLATAIHATQSYTAADPRITLPSFNLREIFQTGQTQLTCGGTPCGLFTPSGLPVFPIQPIGLVGGSISHTATGVRGTAAVFFLLTASGDGAQALQLLSSGGGPISPSSGFRVGIIRVH